MLHAVYLSCVSIWIYVQYRTAMMKVKANAFDALNPGQRRAATFGTVIPDKGVSAGPLLILAGARQGRRPQRRVAFDLERYLSFGGQPHFTALRQASWP